MFKSFQSKLDEIVNGDLYPFHMPGHKRQPVSAPLQEVYRRDITEIDGYDNLHDPEGFILDEERFCAQLFGAEESFYLVNGSSCGILAAIMCVADRPGKYLVARNCHKSVFHALYLSGKDAQYVYPCGQEELPFRGGISVSRIEEQLADAACCAVIITSPTYEGIVSDVRGICEAAHQKNIPVIVDEAHGAHLGIWGGNGYFPESAVRCGADIVIQSTHKTLPAMTQTALLHVQGNLVDRKRLREHLAVFQSSSPSYILMESISDALHFCADHREVLLEEYQQKLRMFYHRTEKLRHLYCIRPHMLEPAFAYGFDPGKLVICIREGVALTGAGLSRILLTRYHIQVEMAEAQYVIAMTSIMDTAEGFERLETALEEVDSELQFSEKTLCAGQPVNQKLTDQIAKRHMPISQKPKNQTPISQTPMSQMPVLEHRKTIREALAGGGQEYDLQDAEGLFSKEYVYLYPPGIPLVVPGEQLTGEVIEYIKEKKDAGLLVKGPANINQNKIMCLEETQTERELL